MVRAYSVADDEVLSDKLTIRVGDKEIPVYTATVSKYPFNRRWPGHQRPLSQTEEAYFAIIEADESFEAEITYKKEIEKVVVRPLSKKITPVIGEKKVNIRINEAGKYTVEADGLHNALHLFVNRPIEFKPEGDVIYFGKGHHDVGEIVLKSNQTLFIDEGAVVYARVFSQDAENITICGNGILDGSKNVEKVLFEASGPDERGFEVKNVERIRTCLFIRCNNLKIQNVTMRDSLVYTVCPVCCKNVYIDNINIIGNWRYNSDGIDMHNCENVFISNCFIRTFDDSICIKGFDYVLDPKLMICNGVKCKSFVNAVISNCVIWNDWGISLEIGAETRADEIKNIVFRDCDLIHNTRAACDIQNCDNADVNGVIFENINVEYEDVSMRLKLQRSEDEEYPFNPNETYMPDLLCARILYIAEYSESAEERGRIRNVLFKNIRAFAPKLPPVSFKGCDTQHIESITVEDIYLNGNKCDIRDNLTLINTDSLIVK